MSATRQELAYQVSLTLGDCPEDFDIEAIVSELVMEYGALDSVDDVPTEQYWIAVRRHDTTTAE